MDRFIDLAWFYIGIHNQVQLYRIHLSGSVLGSAHKQYLGGLYRFRYMGIQLQI